METWDNIPVVTSIDKAHDAIRIAYNEIEREPIKAREKLTYAMGLLESATEFIRPQDMPAPPEPQAPGIGDRVKGGLKGLIS